jgi:plastocyanin
MTLCSKLFSVVAIAVTLHSRAGEITGTVFVKGTPPPEKEITALKDDAICGALHPRPVKTSFYVTGTNGELADAIVMLKNVKGDSKGSDAPPVVIIQKGCLYSPQILAVQTGQKIIVKNADTVFHNVHVQPAVEGNAERNDSQIPGGADLTFSFDSPENFLRFKCEVHPWMFAWVTVVDSPYFAVTGLDGTFKIAGINPGKYTVSVLHRKLAPDGVDKEIQVNETKPTKVDFTLEVK